MNGRLNSCLSEADFMELARYQFGEVSTKQ